MPSSDSARRGRNHAYAAGCLAVAAAAAVGGVLLLTGGGKPEAAPTAPPAPTSPSPSTSPAPVVTVGAPRRPSDIAIAAAKAKYLEYLRVGDQIGQGGYKNLKPYDAVAVDPERIELRREAEQATGITTAGNTKVASLIVQSVELARHGEYPSVRLLACLDVSAVTAVNAAGQSAVAPDRLDRVRSMAVVSKIPPGALTDGRPPGWYISKTVQRGEAC